MKKNLLILFVLCLMISACSPGSESASLAGAWKLVSYGPSDSPFPAVPDAEASINFNPDGTVNGNSGCNSFSGTYEIQGGEITFGPLASTLMACDDPRMSQEAGVHQVLTETAGFEIDGDLLTITNGDSVLVFESVAAK